MDHPPPIEGRKGRWFQFDHEGQSFLLWIDERPDSLQDIIVRTGTFYEVEALQLMRDILPAKARIVDVGANIGNHAIFFDRVCGAEKVFVIEPNPDVLQDLKANAAANACHAIDFSTTGFAVGAESGSGTLFISASDDAIRNRGGISVTQGAHGAGHTVPVRRLDDLDLGRIDFIKIDVEGGALGVLNGAGALLAHSRPPIFVEIDVPDLPSFSGWVRDNGYDVSAAVEYHPGIVNFLLVPRAGAAPQRAGRAEIRADVGAQKWSALIAEKRRADRSENTLAIAVVAMRNADARATEAEGRALQRTSDLRDALTRASDAEGRAQQHSADLRDALARASEAEGRAQQLTADLREALARAKDQTRRVVDAEAEAAMQGQARRAADARAQEAELLAAAHLAALTRVEGGRSLWQRLFFRASGKPKKAVRRLFFHSAGRPRGELKAYVVHPDGRPREAFRRWMTSPEYLAMPDLVRARQTQFIAREARPAPIVREAQPAASAREAQPAPREAPASVRFQPGQKRVLFIDSNYPDPNRDSGSVDTINYLTWLGALGYEVVFLSTRYTADQRAERPVVAVGARILRLSGEQAVADYLRDEGHSFGLFFLSRVHCGGRFFEACRRGNPRADIVFNTVDLHHVREGREARLRQDREAMFRAQTVQERELYVARQSDLTIVVSSLEKDILQKALPGATVGVMPLFRALPAAVADFGRRSGIGFVGGYEHLPNVDAVRYFLETVWPQVHAADPSIRFEIAGPGLPEEIAQALPSGVVYKGQVADLEGWLGGLRLTVAPLRYGAGAKGKVASSIVNGVPVVGTRVAFEGMGLGPDATVAADDAADMAREILRIHSDSAAWDALSRGARAFGAANLSPDAGRARFGALLSSLPGAAAPAHRPSCA